MLTQELCLLLVEDDPVEAELVRVALAKAAPGWSLSVVASLGAALDFLSRQGVDVVLFDMGLPDSQGVAGVDVLLSRFPQQALLVLSGDDDVGMSVRAVQQGAQDYLVKSKLGSATLVRSLLYTVERARARQARRFNQSVVRLLNESSSLDVMLGGFVSEARLLTGCAAVAVRLVDASGDLPYHTAQGLPERFLERACVLNIHGEACLCGDVISGRRRFAPHHYTKRGALAVADLPALIQTLDAADQVGLRTTCVDAGFRTQLLIPIRAGEQFSGVLQLADPAVRKLPPLWIEVLEDTALQLGVAIARVRSAAELRRSEHQLSHLNAVLNAIRKVNSLISHHTDAQELLDGACRALVESRGWQAAWVVTVDAAGKPVRWSEQGLGDAFAELQRRLSPQQLPRCWVATAGEVNVQCIDDTLATCGDCPVAERFRGSGAMAARLRAGGEDLGLLCVSVPGDFEITGEERELFAELASDLAFGLHSQRLASERAETQRRLLLEMRRSHQITELAPVAIVALDLDGRIEWVNRAGCELTGSDEQEIIGRHAFSIFVVERERERMTRDFAAGMGGDFERIRRYESTVRAADGRERLVSWHNTLRMSADGRIEGLLCAGEDVTDRKRAQAQLAQSDRMATVGMLAAGVAHEINNPLTYILYNLEEVAARVPRLIQAVTLLHGHLLKSTDDAAARDLLGELGSALDRDALNELTCCLEDATTGAERVRDIVRDLKVFSRVDDDTRRLTDLRTPVETAISMTFNEVKYRARLLKELPAMPLVLANDGRLAQVFVNLIINAAQAIQEGDALNQQIAVRGRVVDQQVEIEVSDTGKGIPADELPLIFEPFFTTKPAGIGSGLGLSISRSIITGLGGEILVDSAPGKGARFRVRLPVVSAQPTSASAFALAEPAPPPRRGRVLVVDDDPLLRSLIERVLASQHEVVCSASGAAAIELLGRDSGFDAMLCDVMMPEVTGVEVYAHVQAAHPDLAARFIFMTGGIFTPTTREHLQKNARPTIEKPFEPAELRRLVAEVIAPAQPS